MFRSLLEHFNLFHQDLKNDINDIQEYKKYASKNISMINPSIELIYKPVSDKITNFGWINGVYYEKIDDVEYYYGCKYCGYMYDTIRHNSKCEHCGYITIKPIR